MCDTFLIFMEEQKRRIATVENVEKEGLLETIGELRAKAEAADKAIQYLMSKSK